MNISETELPNIIRKIIHYTSYQYSNINDKMFQFPIALHTAVRNSDRTALLPTEHARQSIC